MTLADWREDVEAAATGELAVLEDLRVRQHLRTCDECRKHYDELVSAKRVLSGGRDEHDALFARLNAALDAKEQPKAVTTSPRRWWLFGALAAAAAAVLLLVWPPAEVEREVTLRGGPNDVAPNLSFFVYAKAKSGGAVRLLAQFPQSGEAHASEQDWLQVKAPPGVTVVATSGDAVVVFDAGGSQTLSKGTWKVFAARGSAEDARKKPSVGVLVVEP